MIRANRTANNEPDNERLAANAWDRVWIGANLATMDDADGIGHVAGRRARHQRWADRMGRLSFAVAGNVVVSRDDH